MELRRQGYKVTRTHIGNGHYEYHLAFDVERDVESSGRDRSPDDHRSSSPAVALSVTDGVEGGNGTARPSGALGRRSLPERPLNPYEFDLLDVA